MFESFGGLSDSAGIFWSEVKSVFVTYRMQVNWEEKTLTSSEEYDENVYGKKFVKYLPKLIN